MYNASLYKEEFVSITSVSTSPRLGDRKHTTRWIKIISNPKPWEILYISMSTGDKHALLAEEKFKLIFIDAFSNFANIVF